MYVIQKYVYIYSVYKCAYNDLLLAKTKFKIKESISKQPSKMWLKK